MADTPSNMANSELLTEAPQWLGSGTLAQAILDGMVGSICILDSAGVIVSVNRSWVEFGSKNGLLTPHDAIGSSYIDVCRADRSTLGRKLVTGLSKVLAGEQALFACNYTCHSPTQQRWYEMQAQRASGDGQTHVVVVHHPITPLKKIEAKLRKTARNLEKVVIERTRALAERDLLLREVYHRVKNNLQVVDGLLMIQARQIKDQDTRESLMGLRAKVFALGLIHQQLMTSADLKTLDISAFLGELMAHIADAAIDDRLKLTVNSCPLDVGLEFAVPLGLLVTELVANSFKHAFPNGVGEVSVVLRPNTAGGVVLIVSDDGQGVSKEDSAPATAGLGLSIVNRLVAQLQGEMVVRQDAGTIIEISIPLQDIS